MLSVALLALLGVVAAPAQASPESPAADEAQFVSLINANRANAGLAPLTVDNELRTLSRSWAQHQADQGHIAHANPISEGVTSDWLKLGENVGTGGSVTAVMNAFMASPGHRANVMDPEFTKVGVGVVWSGNALYTTHRFMKVNAAAAPPPEPAPAPAETPVAAAAATPEPAPAPAPAPKPAARKVPTTTSAPPPTTTSAPPTPPPARASRVTAVLATLAAASR